MGSGMAHSSHNSYDAGKELLLTDRGGDAESPPPRYRSSSMRFRSRIQSIGRDAELSGSLPTNSMSLSDLTKPIQGAVERFCCVPVTDGHSRQCQRGCIIG